jgi:Rrf2 family iron-sulfur cluster assembly transcriptional regulator
MRITQEADYAVRIIDNLARLGRRLDARTVSENTGVTLRFTLKIMRKLAICNIVKSFKGVQGGYELAHKPEEINLRQVIEAVDGPIVINRCLTGELPCSRIDDKRLCYYHNVFANVSETVRNKLEKITFQP